MTATGSANPPPRPQRADVTASYDLGVDTYQALWSPVILPPAQALIAGLDLGDSRTVLDVGSGTGALVPAIRARAPQITVITLDASMGMLAAARATNAAPAAQADAMALPIGDTTVDAVILAYVLFHVGEPAVALSEAARVLREEGRIGTITWSRERGATAHQVWEDLLTEAGVPPLPVRRNDTDLDSADTVADLLTHAGLQPQRIWTEQLSHRWNPTAFWRLITGSGQTRLRLRHVEVRARQGILTQARHRLASLQPEDYQWTGEVTCATGTKRPPGTAAATGGSWHTQQLDG
jgi:SAM-dependent methyltransferase